MVCSKANLDIPYLTKILANERKNRGESDIPLHRRHEARNPEYQTDSSCVFIVEDKEFRQMSAKTIQTIFRHRHILVLNVEPNDNWTFGEESLSRLGPLDQERQMQGKAVIYYSSNNSFVNCTKTAAHRKTDDHSESMLMKGTFRDVLNAVDHSIIINALDVPMGESLLVHVPPGLSHLASEEYAKLHVSPLPISTMDFRNDVIWATVSNLGAISGAHIDDDGLATTISVETGGKMWAIATPVGRTVEDIQVFQMTESADFETDEYRFEILHLPPKCVL